MQRITPFLWFDDKDRKKAHQVMQAMLQMKKLDIAKLKQAYEQA